MGTFLARGTIRPLLGRIRFALLLLALLAPAALSAQKSGLAFWEPPKAADPILERSPHNDPGRYAALRQAFVDFHCTPDQMQEQPVGTRGDKNLICTLPGQTSNTILVAARYDGRAGAGFQATWVDAFLLPLLDHALQAQPRRHTFVFAALFGQDGEAAFFSQLRSSGKPLPHAMIILDGLGYGLPLWYTVAPTANVTRPEDLGVNGLLGAVAAAVSRVMKIPSPAPLSPAHFLTESGFAAAEYYRHQRFESTLFRSAGPIPELLIYGDQPEAATQQTVDVALPDIHKQLDYTAWVLCLADLKLDPPAAPAAPAATPAAAPASSGPAPNPATSATTSAAPASPQN